MMKALAVLLLVVLTTTENAQSRAAQTRESQAPPIQQVLAVDEARRKAMLEGNVEVLDRILAKDVTIFWGDGTEDDKASTLQLFRSGRLHYDHFEYRKTRARLFAGTAVLTGEGFVKASSAGHTISYLVRSTRVYVRQNARWMLVASQTTRVKPLQ